MERDWSGHLRKSHQPIVDYIELVARQMASGSPHSTGHVSPSHDRLSCPLGCAFQSMEPAPAKVCTSNLMTAAVQQRTSPQLADRMMAAIRAESKVILDIKEDLFAPTEELVEHLCKVHRPELQFIASYAHELASSSCCPSVLEVAGLSLPKVASAAAAGRITTPLTASGPITTPLTASAGDGRRVLHSACPFSVLVEARKRGEEASSTDCDDEPADMHLSPCDGAGTVFHRGNEAAAVHHLIKCHMEDLSLIAKHTADQCRKALELNCPGRCHPEVCQVGTSWPLECEIPPPSSHPSVLLTGQLLVPPMGLAASGGSPSADSPEVTLSEA